MFNQSYNFILIGGGRLDGKLATLAPGSVKALLPVGNQILLDIALAAIQGLNTLYPDIVGEIAVVGGEEIQTWTKDKPQVKYVSEGISGVQNVYRALKAFASNNPAIVVSPDLPFINTEALEDFISQLQLTDDMVLAIIDKKNFLARFPDAKNRFEKIQGKEITLASIFMVRKDAFSKNVPYFEDIFRQRKHPIKLALLLGIDLVIKLLLGFAGIPELVKRATRNCDCTVRAVYCKHAELVYDIDNWENYQFALGMLKRS